MKQISLQGYLSTLLLTHFLPCESIPHRQWQRYALGKERNARVVEEDPGGSAEGSLRLIGGSTESSGRLQVLHDRLWGNICDDGFGEEAANVACGEFDFAFGRTVPYVPLGQASGSDQIWLDDLDCSGEEGHLVDCGHAGWGVHDCGQHEDVAVECAAEPFPNEDEYPMYETTLYEHNLKLVGGSSESSGRVEIVYNGRWITLCDDTFYRNEANVVCRDLGFDRGIPRHNAYFGQGSNDSMIATLGCSGDELIASDCRLMQMEVDIHGKIIGCTHKEDAGVDCLNNGDMLFAEGEEGEVRLSDGVNRSSGRVEIYHQGSWGTVCDDHLDDTAATVVCRGLGYQQGIMNTRSYYSRATGPILLDEVVCDGDEGSILECTHAGWGVHDCSHDEDYGVRCLQ